MNTRRNTVRVQWLPILAVAAILAAADGVGAESAESRVMEEAFARSCVAPYHESVAGWPPAQLDKEAYWQVVLEARAVAAGSCSAFVELIEKDVEPDGEENPLLRDARDLLAHTPEGRCLEAQAITEVVRSAQSLYKLALCTPRGEEKVALFREAVEINPRHIGSLLFLSQVALNSQTRAEYGALLHRRTKGLGYRLTAAKAMIEGAVDRGDLSTVVQIHESVRQDLLDQPPLSRCYERREHLGVVDICLEGLEALAADAVSAGEVLPQRVVSLVDNLFWEIGLSIPMPTYVRSEAEVAHLLATPDVRAQLAGVYEREPEIRHILEDEVELAEWMRGEPATVEVVDRDALLAQWLGWEPWGSRKAAQADRLAAILENHPERLRTSEHYLALANTATTWEDRMESLLRAVEVGEGSVRARCELAGALGRVGKLEEARRGYRELLADDDGSCHAQQRLENLIDRAPPDLVSLDEPRERFFYLK